MCLMNNGYVDDRNVELVVTDRTSVSKVRLPIRITNMDRSAESV